MVALQLLSIHVCLGLASSAYTAKDYLSDEFFPGMHVLERVDENSLFAYFRSQKPGEENPPLQVPTARWKTMAEARRELEILLSIPPREPLQLDWAFFDPMGISIEDLFTLKNSPNVFILEVGVWMWPAVRIGFEQNISQVHEDGSSASLKTISLRPVIFEVHDFMSPAETEAVISIGKEQGLHNSQGVLQSADIKKGTAHSQFRTSKQAWLDNSLSPLIERLDQRISRLTRVPAAHNEPVQLLRYAQSNYYHAHMDWTELELYPDQREIWLDAHFGYQDRLANVFWYLNDVEEGGETIFPKHGQQICSPESRGGPSTRICPGAEDPQMDSCKTGLKVKPRRGSILFWYNFLASGRGDRNALHAGCPVGKNLTKWSANKWVRIKPLESRNSVWINDHPALNRFGWRTDEMPSTQVDSCNIEFKNNYDEEVTLVWIGPDGKHPLATVAVGGSIGQQSFTGHEFQLQTSMGTSSNVIACEPPSSTFVLEKSLSLRRLTDHSEDDFEEGSHNEL